jgi:hypothetical protein
MAETRSAARGALRWLLPGLLLGLGLGLLLGWVAWPLQLTEVSPSLLDESYRRDYALMIAAAYSLDGDLNGARLRLSALEDRDLPDWLLPLTVDQVLHGQNEAEKRALVRLAADLGLSSPAMAPYLPPEDPP